MKFLSQFIDEVFDKTIMDNISLSGFQISLTFPNIIWNVVTSYSKGQSFLRQPEVGQNIIMLIFICWRKYQNKSCNIRCTGKVESTVADSSFQFGFIKSDLAFVPLFHRHPTDSLFYPLIESKLSESVFFSRCFLCRITRRQHLIHADCLVE